MKILQSDFYRQQTILAVEDENGKVWMIDINYQDNFAEIFPAKWETRKIYVKDPEDLPFNGNDKKIKRDVKPELMAPLERKIVESATEKEENVKKRGRPKGSKNKDTETNIDPDAKDLLMEVAAEINKLH